MYEKIRNNRWQANIVPADCINHNSICLIVGINTFTKPYSDDSSSSSTSSLPTYKKKKSSSFSNIANHIRTAVYNGYGNSKNRSSQSKASVSPQAMRYPQTPTYPQPYYPANASRYSGRRHSY